MSTQQDIAQRVRKVIADVACKPLEQVTDEASLVADLDMDSLDEVVLDADLEDEFGFRFEDNEGSDQFKTVGDVVALVQRATLLPALQHAVRWHDQLSATDLDLMRAAIAKVTKGGAVSALPNDALISGASVPGAISSDNAANGSKVGTVAVQTPKPLRTFGDGKRCAECCNGDRCDDPTHYSRKQCPHCKGTSWAIWSEVGRDDYLRYLQGWGRMSPEEANAALAKATSQEGGASHE